MKLCTEEEGAMHIERITSVTVESCMRRVMTLMATNRLKPDPVLLRETINDTKTIFLCAYEDGLIVGFGMGHIVVTLADVRFYVSDIVVEHRLRKQGLRERLLDELKNHADRYQCVWYEKNAIMIPLDSIYMRA